MDANAWAAENALTPHRNHRDLPVLLPASIDSFDEARQVWREHDILIVLADLHGFHDRYPEHLDRRECARKASYLTEYARLRFSVSRTLAKHLLAAVHKAESPGEITLEMKPEGGIRVAGDGSVHLCISYAHDLLALGIARENLGIDIERIRPLALHRIAPLVGTAGGEDEEGAQDCTAFFRYWTAMEAYAKFSSTPLWNLLQHPSSGHDGCTQSFMLAEGVILSVVTDMPCPSIAALHANGKKSDERDQE